MDAAVGYARLSLDRNGEGLAIARQREDMEHKARALGWTLVEFYEDNDTTADPKKKVRPAFQRLLSDMREGRVKRVLCYDQDRLVRDPRELEDIVDAVEAGDVLMTSANGDIDLRTDNGRMVARIKGAVAKNELEKISRRTKRQKQQRIEQGLPLGQRFRTFGYTRDWKVVEEEAAIVREVFKRAVAGESQNAITKDLISRGIKTAANGEWTALQTSRMLKTPKYAGFQTYQGKIVGKSQVPAIVSEAEYEAVQNPSNGASYNFRKYLLSGILVCDECKAPMSGTRVVHRGKESVRYRCDVRNGGCGSVSIKGEWIDGLINRYMAWAVTHEAYSSPKELPPDHTSEIAEIDARIADFQERMGNGTMDIEDAMAAIKAARASRKKLVAADAASITTEAQRTPIEDYDALSDDAKRVAIRRWFRYIFIKPGRRVRYFDESRVYVLTADGQLKAGGAINTVDLRDPSTHGPEYVFDPARGF